MGVLVCGVLVHNIWVAVFAGRPHLLHEFREPPYNVLYEVSREGHLHFVCGYCQVAVATLHSRLAHLGFILLVERPYIDAQLSQCAVRVFRRLFHFDFRPIEADLGIDCFTVLSNYRAIPKKAQMYYRNVSEKVRALSAAIEQAKDENEIFDLVTAHYRDWGVGMFGLNRAFRIRPAENGGVEFCAINNIDSVVLDDLIGYEYQKKELRANTEAFVSGRSCNNMLLYGDAGTGKSTSVKAILNEYCDRGLRMIEIYKHQFGLLSEVIARVKNRKYRFMIFIDDLSFEEHEVEYKFLKAVIEGGVETKPDNVLICATSNRRHLIQETWKDRNDMEFNGDVHRSDTMEEKLSLAARFGCAINYNNPDRKQYHDIVKGIASRCGDLGLTEEQLLLEANKWEIRHGGISGRTAQQFINYLAGTVKKK